MPKPAECTLSIDPKPDPQGFYHLRGQASRQQVRRKNRDLDELESLKDELTRAHNAAFADEAAEPVRRPTRLNQDRLEDAEGLYRKYGQLPRSLEEYVEAGMKLLGNGTKTLLRDSEDGKTKGAVSQWYEYMIKRIDLQPRTAQRNRRAVDRMVEAHPEFLHVCDITAEAVDQACSLEDIGPKVGKGGSGYTAVCRMWNFSSFFKFCVKRKFIRLPVWTIDEDEVKKLLAGAAKKKGDPVVLDGEEAHALLTAAIRYDQRYIPYVALCLWCFTRPSEATKLTPDKVRLDDRLPFIQPRGGKRGTANYRETHIPEVIVPVLRKCIEEGIWPEGTTPFFAINSFRALREKAGLVKQSDKPTKKGYRKVIGGKWVPDIMRHTGISMLYQKLASAQVGFFNKDAIDEQVTSEAGNSVDVAYKHYITLNGPEDAKVFFSESQGIRNFIAQPMRTAVNW